ncbi:MAG: dUTP diphosphatase, partial [Bacteroidetes bacterium]|nr:dUTP diphosphatase [Bacteroidota bacterium]
MSKIKLKIKKLDNRATIPSYAKKGDAGIDLVATTMISNGYFIEYGTDLAIEIPEGYVGYIFPRSSISKTDHYLRNSVGVIDSGYRGEIKIRMSIPELGSKQYINGDKIAQLIIMKLPWVDIEEVDELSETDR